MPSQSKESRILRPVVQEEVTGCGIASVAALTGRSYRQVQRLARELGIVADDQRLWSETRHVRTLLRHFGYSASAKERAFESWAALPPLALLATQWHLEKGRPYWHWTVFWRAPDGPVVLDSKRLLRQHARRDFGRIKPKWFIEVRAPALKPAGLSP